MELPDGPPITRFYSAAAILTSIAVRCQIVTPFQLFFTYRAAFENQQLWRLLTTFLYFGPLSLDFFFHLFFFARYSRMLEQNTFYGRRADYLWLVIVCSTFLLLLSPLSPSPFLASSLSFTLVYLWARLNPAIRLSLFGLVTITAPYLPFALVIFSWTLSPSPYWSGFIGDCLGILVGHIWYFFNYVWVREDASGKRNWLATPSILTRLLDEPRNHQEQENENENENETQFENEAENIANEQQQQQQQQPQPHLQPQQL